MYHRFAEILGRHAADVFKTMSGLQPDRLEIVEALPDDGPRYPMGVRVYFRGSDQSGFLCTGFFICAFETLEAAGDIAKTIAVKLGVEDTFSETLEGIDSVLGEFLNIVIGLTCSDWSDQGLVTEFNPPEPLVRYPQVTISNDGLAFHLTMFSEGHPSVTFFLVLLPESAPVPSCPAF
ncbi:MAG: hypothetical protein LBT47_04545 [Deltaproteobacteria bacterium]|nr:hypothetical protein [Deltaproteobacteria bacterium]